MCFLLLLLGATWLSVFMARIHYFEQQTKTEQQVHVTTQNRNTIDRRFSLPHKSQRCVSSRLALTGSPLPSRLIDANGTSLQDKCVPGGLLVAEMDRARISAKDAGARRTQAKVCAALYACSWTGDANHESSFSTYGRMIGSEQHFTISLMMQIMHDSFNYPSCFLYLL